MIFSKELARVSNSKIVRNREEETRSQNLRSRSRGQFSFSKTCFLQCSLLLFLLSLHVRDISENELFTLAAALEFKYSSFACSFSSLASRLASSASLIASIFSKIEFYEINQRLFPGHKYFLLVWLLWILSLFSRSARYSLFGRRIRFVLRLFLTAFFRIWEVLFTFTIWFRRRIGCNGGFWFLSELRVLVRELMKPSYQFSCL